MGPRLGRSIVEVIQNSTLRKAIFLGALCDFREVSRDSVARGESSARFAPRTRCRVGWRGVGDKLPCNMIVKVRDVALWLLGATLLAFAVAVACKTRTPSTHPNETPPAPETPEKRAWT